MANQANIKAVITADDRASGTLKNFGNNVDNSNKRITKAAKAGAIALAALATAAVAFGVKSVKAFSESQDVMAQTNAVLKSTKSVAGVTADEVTRLAKSLQGVTRFSDETIQSGENLLLTFTNIGKDIFPQATETMLNMSQALGQDVKSSAIQLGKALQDPILGITALRRVGVNFNDAQKEVIVNLVNTGRAAEAQKLILKELQVEFGGSARAAGETFAGKLDILKNKFNDVQERIGELILKALVPLGIKLLEIGQNIDINSQKLGGVRNAFQTIGNYLATTFKAALDLVANGLRMLQPIFNYVAEVIRSQTIPALQRMWQQIGPLLTPAAKILGSVIGGMLIAALLALTVIILGAARVVTALASRIASLVSWLRNATATARAFGSGVITWIVGATKTAINIVNSLGSTFGRMRQSVGSAMSGIANTIVGPFRSAFSAIVAAWNNTVGRISFSVPDWVPKLGGKGWSMPRFAEGVRNFGGGVALVGEKGPEVVTLPQGSNVYSNKDSKGMLGSGAVNITIQAGAFMGNQQDARKYAEMIFRAYKDLQASRGNPNVLSA